MNLSDELQKLQELHQSGAIDDAEFALAKAKILNGTAPGTTAKATLFEEIGTGLSAAEPNTRQWAFLLHISVLAGLIFPIAGLVVPIMIWQLKKATLPEIDEHGKNAMNWIISATIYAVVGVILIPVVLIGLLILFPLGVVSIVFPIIAAIKANNGVIWKYPLSISFFK